MATQTVLKHTIPEYGDPADMVAAFTAFSNSVHAFIPVNSVAEAQKIVSSAPAAAFPLFFSVDPDRSIYAAYERTIGLEWIGGRRTIWDGSMYQTNIPRNKWQNIGLNAPVRVRGDFKLSADNVTLTLPESGIWAINTRARLVTSVSSNPEHRTLLEIRVGSDGFAYRTSTSGEDQLVVNFQKYQSAGTRISVWLYQNMADTLGINGGDLSAVLLAPA
ncbi:hypothetical protein ACU19_04960 [Actinobaculum suis]|uniref:hypothetical protein n=1 Tax=Actinobaculum suis TaxID=1657 RepID=UPI00066FBF7B|nr:hypothetical protein [Actinobaculum suis]KMY23324.1 hypothetical protein ACU19_04960 [Actinobaculum suis]